MLPRSQPSLRSRTCPPLHQPRAALAPHETARQPPACLCLQARDNTHAQKAQSISNTVTAVSKSRETQHKVTQNLSTGSWFLTAQRSLPHMPYNSSNNCSGDQREPCPLQRGACHRLPASVDSAPVAVARTVSGPSYTTVPPATAAPGRFCTSTLSPVSMDSSSAATPSSTSPSHGTRSPVGSSSSSNVSGR
jgi:hypothetical protein